MRYLIALLLLVNIAISAITPLDIKKEVERGNYKKAQSMLLEVIKEYPDSAKAYYMLSQVYSLEHHYNKAYKELKKAKALDPTLSFADKDYLKKYELALKSSIERKEKRKSFFGMSKLFFIVGILLIMGGGLLYFSKIFGEKQDKSLRDKLLEEVASYLNALEEIKTKLEIDLAQTNTQELQNRVNEIKELKSNLTDFLSKVKNNEIKDYTKAYDYFEKIKEKTKEVALGIKKEYEENEKLKKLNQNTQNNVNSGSFITQGFSQGSSFPSFMGILGALAVGELMGSFFMRPTTIIEEPIIEQNNLVDSQNSDFGSDLQNGLDTGNIDIGQDNSWDDSDIDSGSDSWN